MKKAIIAIIILAPLFSFSQDFKIDEETKLITYTEVIEIPNTSKSELFLRANTWISKAFKSAKAVIDFQDKDAGKIIGKGSVSTSIKMPLSPRTESGYVDMTITILCKDGKYKFTIDNLKHSAPLTTGTGTWISVGPLEQEKAKAGMLNRPSNPEWKELKIDADNKIKSLVAELKKTMSKSEGDF